jgi:hypothetical protein
VGEKLLDDRPHRTTPAVTPGISPTSSSKTPLKPHSKSIPNWGNKINNNKIYNNKPLSDPQLIKKNNELAKRIGELETSILDVEKERDFYFRKLRNMELMLQVKQDQNFDECDLTAMVDNIFKVLYATADDEVAVDEDGEVKSNSCVLSQYVLGEIRG